jgi:hypothetical protein
MTIAPGLPLLRRWGGVYAVANPRRCHRRPLRSGIITVTKQPLDLEASSPPDSGAGAPEMVMVSEADLALAIRTELEEFFHDGVSPTLGRYEIQHIIGGIIQRVASAWSAGIE